MELMNLPVACMDFSAFEIRRLYMHKNYGSVNLIKNLEGESVSDN